MRTAVLLLAGLLAWPAAPQTPQTPAPKAKKSPFLKLIEPWPTPEKMKERREEAEKAPLFVEHDVLPVTLVGDFKAINKDRDPDSRKLYPGVVRVGEQNTEIVTQFRARGHSRRNARTCDYVPLKLEFGKKVPPGTVFGGQDALKLVVQCSGGSEYEQFLLKEYLAYRIHNVITPYSFRPRLARVTYVDKASGKVAGTRLGMFLEDDKEVAKRLEGRIVDLPRLAFADVASDPLMTAMIFEYMIGNTDMSIYALHNFVIVQRPDKTLHPVPYDFDMSGIVNAPYAVPARGFIIKSVTERVYRGPCRNQEMVDPYIANFVAKQDAVRALPESIPGISKQTRDETRDYINSFYRAIRTPKDVRSIFVSCDAKTLM